MAKLSEEQEWICFCSVAMKSSIAESMQALPWQIDFLKLVANDQPAFSLHLLMLAARMKAVNE